MNSEMQKTRFKARLKKLIGETEPFVWAKNVGIPSGTFARIWKDGTIPKAGHLCRIAEKCNVTLDWLVRGIEGPNLVSPSKELLSSTMTGPVIRRALISKIFYNLQKLRSEQNIHLTEKNFEWAYEYAWDKANQIANVADNEEQEDALIKFLINEEREKIKILDN